MDRLVVDLENAIWRKFVGSSMPPQFPYVCSENPREAVLGRTVCYIVGAVVVHEGRVLMMREAKRSCRGTWYLPAGRVEQNESLEEAVVREVLEETGLHFQPTSIICIDSQGTSWFRFTFSGVITGGKIKTLQEQDAESMEAGWFTAKEVFDSLNLRATDICPVIDAGLKWYETKQDRSICKLLPVEKPHKYVIVKLAVVKRLEKEGKKSLYCVLFLNKKTNVPCPCFPHEVIDKGGWSEVTSVIDRLMRGTGSGIAYNTLGFLYVEHTGKPHVEADGLCLTVLVEILENGILNDSYEWFEIEDNDLRDKIWDLVETKGCVDLMQH